LFFLLALYFEALLRRREGTATPAEEYELSMANLLPLITSCLDALDSANGGETMKRLNLLAQTAAVT
jgi:hypothetical protein